MTIDKKAEELAEYIMARVGSGILDGKAPSMLLPELSKHVASALRQERQEAAERAIIAIENDSGLKDGEDADWSFLCVAILKEEA